ncbi:MAG TPA: carboxylating nicotinate-nucleotide diphosphorylase, partial [Pyrinomonadaceae bacterium]|nr:carboxylating nicotinate-nucleotide diphosphorylase [Pyrinomonadaceae bacterium]
DSQPQLEAFVADGEEIEAGKVIARMIGFADVLLAGEQVALNLLQRLSAVATLTNQFVRAVEGTGAAIVDSRQTTPGLRMLERYAVLLGGGDCSRLGLDDGVLITANHLAVAGGVADAVKSASKKLGSLHKIKVQVSNDDDLREAVINGAESLLLEGLSPDDVRRLSALARSLSSSVSIECSGDITLQNVRAYAEAGANHICVGLLTNSAKAMKVTFQLQPF